MQAYFWILAGMNITSEYVSQSQDTAILLATLFSSVPHKIKVSSYLRKTTPVK